MFDTFTQTREHVHLEDRGHVPLLTFSKCPLLGSLLGSQNTTERRCGNEQEARRRYTLLEEVILGFKIK
jgi:hypothetical protein